MGFLSSLFSGSSSKESVKMQIETQKRCIENAKRTIASERERVANIKRSNTKWTKEQALQSANYIKQLQQSIKDCQYRIAQSKEELKRCK